MCQPDWHGICSTYLVCSTHAVCLPSACPSRQGCHLGPGSYKHTSSIDELLAHSVSKRGPYDLFTGERDKAVKVCVRVCVCVVID